MTRLLSWLPAMMGMALLFYTSSLPGSEIRLPPFPYSDKIVHLAAYAVLGALIALRKSLRRRFASGLPDPGADRVGPDFWGMAAGMIYGVCDEIHQIFVPMRMFGFSDMAADFLGVVAGVWAYRKFSRRASGAA